MLILILCIIAIFILVAFMPISIRFETLQRKDDQILVMRIITLYGLAKFKFDIPYIDFVIKGLKPILRYGAKVEAGKSEKDVMKKGKLLSIFDIKSMRRVYKLNKARVNKLTSYMIKRIKIRSLYMHVEFGTNDAFYTAFIYGLLWTVLGSLISILESTIDASVDNISVMPSFDKKVLYYDISCIIKLKAGHIIIAGMKALPILLKMNKKAMAQG